MYKKRGRRRLLAGQMALDILQRPPGRRARRFYPLCAPAELVNSGCYARYGSLKLMIRKRNTRPGPAQ